MLRGIGCICRFGGHVLRVETLRSDEITKIEGGPGQNPGVCPHIGDGAWMIWQRKVKRADR